MKSTIQIIEVSTGNVVLEIKTLEQLLSFFKEEKFQEDFQKRDALEKLLSSTRDNALSMNCAWRAKLLKNNKNERKSKKQV